MSTPALHNLAGQIDELKSSITDGQYLNLMNTLGDIYKENKAPAVPEPQPAPPQFAPIDWDILSFDEPDENEPLPSFEGVEAISPVLTPRHLENSTLDNPSIINALMTLSTCQDIQIEFGFSDDEDSGDENSEEDDEPTPAPATTAMVR